MSFKEKFPSLHTKEGYEDGWDEGGGFTHDMIEKNCLDKQKVKKIIDDMWRSTKERPAIDGNYLELIKRLDL